MIYNEPKKVMIAWIDAQSSDDSWSEIVEPVELPIIESLGFLVAANSNCITLITNIDTANDHVSGRIDIPRVAIESIYEVDLLKKINLSKLCKE